MATRETLAPLNAPPEPIFAEGDRVVQQSSPDIIGVVDSAPVWDQGDWWYKVWFGRNRTDSPEFQLLAPPDEGEPLERIAMDGRWGDYNALRKTIAVERILKHNRSTVYSYNAQRIQFLPHQYKPLLRLLESEDRRLLIADEVGLGKTVEAGLVLSELQARQALDRVLVICPSRLRVKWQEEMRRKFGQDFEIWDRDQLQAYIRRVSSSPRRYPFRAIASIQMLRRQDLLSSLLEVTHEIDLLIFDEAHHARNRSTSTHAMVERLGRIADCFLMLTATPMHLDSDDLFSLLQILREGEYTDSYAFRTSLVRNVGIVHAQAVVRARDVGGLQIAAAVIRKSAGVEHSQVHRDPLLEEALSMLEADPPERPEEWLALERILEQAHVLSNVLTRTKKRDVYEFSAERKGRWIHVSWTPEEERAYCLLAGFDPDRPLDDQTFGLGQIQRARQAASSLIGTIQYRRAQDAADTPDEQSDLEDEDAHDDSLLTLEAPPTDSKYEKLLEVLKGLLEEDPSRKVMVFTFFVGTSQYLTAKLNDDGLQTLRIAGDVPSNPKNPEKDERSRIIDRFRDDHQVRVLVSTEVGSEGLDFQFCSCLVNYDLPWNPMVVEQRIGRIDRFGQEAEVLQIHSLVAEGTIEDRIIKRLLDRIGLFKSTIGDLELILGDEVSQLRSDFYSGKLTAAELEKKSEEQANVIAARIHDTRELEEKAADLVGHEDYIREQVRKVKQLGRYLTSSQIRAVIGGYLELRHPDIQIQELGEDEFRIRITDRLLQEIDAASDSGQHYSVDLRMRSQGGYLYMTTNGDKAYKDSKLDLLNATHPLVRVSAMALEGLMDEPIARVASVQFALADLSAENDGHLPLPGQYFLMAFTVTISGVRARRIMEVSATARGSDCPLPGDSAERLLHLCLERGRDHPARERVVGMPESAWKRLESDSRARTLAHQKREERENRALYSRRRQRVQDERERKMKGAEQRLETVLNRRSGVAAEKMARSIIDGIEADYMRRMAELDSSKTVQVDLEYPPVVCCFVEVL